MVTALTLANSQALKDFDMLLSRLAAAGAKQVWLKTRVDHSGTILVTLMAGIMFPDTPLSDVPTVIIGKTFPVQKLHDNSGQDLDAVYELAALKDRTQRMQKIGELKLGLPPNNSSAVWAGINPPDSGWKAVAAVSVSSLKDVAFQGAKQVAKALPENPGEAIVARVRDQIWRQSIVLKLVAAVAFGMETAGFLDDTETAEILENGNWYLLRTSYGYALQRTRI